MKSDLTPFKRIVYICDWLPPDYGAVGQYATIFARELAREGNDVVLAGLTTDILPRETPEHAGEGSLTTIRLRTTPHQKNRFLKRILWTAIVNTRLLLGTWTHLRRADEIIVTGSPPLLLHWIAPASLLLRKRLIYRITDFHPECLIAAGKWPRFLLLPLYWLTLFWRRRVDQFEILGEDQRRRLHDIGIAPRRIKLKRDPSPVTIEHGTPPLSRPAAYADKLLLLYSGNWGVAHDTKTFLAAYDRHHRQGSGRFVLWLNAVGALAGSVEADLREKGLPLIRSAPVPLGELASLLVTPDAHLITLADPFVGFVLPSKVYGCVASKRPVLFVGSAASDVHLLCAGSASGYARADEGDADGCFMALEKMAKEIDAAALECARGVGWGEPGREKPGDIISIF